MRKRPASLNFNYPKWTAEDDATIHRLRAAGQSYEDVAKAINRTVSAIYNRLTKIGNATPGRRRKAAERDKIPCLRCRNLFASAGPHNRLCPECKRHSVSPYAI